MTKSRRIVKVSSLLKKEISLILMMDLDEPLIIENFVSITKIELSKDLQHCKVFIRGSIQDSESDKVIENLNLVKNKIRHLLSKRIQMRRIPEIIFKKDITLDNEISVLKVLDRIRNKDNVTENS